MLQGNVAASTTSDRFLCSKRPKPTTETLDDKQYMQLLESINTYDAHHARTFGIVMSQYSKSNGNTPFTSWLRDHSNAGLISPSVVKHVLARVPARGRVLEYRCEEWETSSSSGTTVSSIVTYKLPVCSTILIGRIQHFIEAGQHELAYIKWYGKGIFWNDTSMLCCVPDPIGRNPFKKLPDLSPPMLHAWEDDVLWIPQSYHS